MKGIIARGSFELIERFECKWRWDYLTHNKALPWSLELLERFKGNWFLEVLSYNNAAFFDSSSSLQI